jgi:predicted nuclease of predicted toxin-antitoxin system
LKLLLDEHIWPGVAALVKRQNPKAEVESIHHYADGSLRNTTDDEVLAEAHRDGWTLVTFDLNTIPRLLSEKAVVREDHSGIIFISSKSFAQNDHVRLAQALSSVTRSESASDWTNRVMFLSRKETSQN